MEVKPGYKQTEVGIIPEDWEIKPIVQLINPTAPICYGLVQVGSNDHTGIPIVAIKFIKNILKSPLHRASKHIEKNYNRSRVQPGDILISIKGTIGRVGIVPKGFKGNISRDLARLRIDEKYSSGFIAYQLKSNCTQERIFQAVVGTTRLEFSIASLRSFVLPFPISKNDQRRIAKTLNDTDALIESLEQLIAKKRKIKQGAMQGLLSGRKRLLNFKEDWKKTKLGEICSLKSGEGITSKKITLHGKYPCYGGNGFRGFTTKFTHNGNYALIGRQGALCGNVIGVRGKFFASEHALVVTAKPGCDIIWLTWVLSNMDLNQYSESSAQPGLSAVKLIRLNLPVPPSIAEQKAIAQILTDMDKEIETLETKLFKARQIKQGMMENLLTGKIRLIQPEESHDRTSQIRTRDPEPNR